jgi:aspartate/methionine/tyrosine aminotransferase
MRAVDAVNSALEAHTGRLHSWLVGEPFFEPPAVLVDALNRAASAGVYGYPPHDGLQALREILAARHRSEGHPTSPEQVVVTAGAKGGLLALLAALLEPGDELVHPQPCYPAYPAIARRLGACGVAVTERDGCFSGWPQAVAETIGPRTRAVVLASPSNPTGATLESEVAGTLVELCRDRGIRLICDEAYSDFRFAPEGQTLPAAFDGDRTTVVQVRSASKSWALCGWRVGWVTADVDLARRVARTHASLLNPASGPAQAALCSLPEVQADYLDDARSMVANRTNELCSALESAGCHTRRPDGGFYLWLDVLHLVEASGASDLLRWSVELAERCGIGLWPGEDFGGQNHVRIAVTAPTHADWPAAVDGLVRAVASPSRKRA